METSTVASYSGFNSHLNTFHGDEFVYTSKHSSTHDSETNSRLSGLDPSFHSTAYDEDFAVNEEEEVSTPRSSPTLSELHRLLAAGDSGVQSNSSTSLSPTSGLGKILSPTLRMSLSDAASKPCHYPLERLFDESIPSQSRQWLKDSMKKSVEMCSLIEKVTHSPKSRTSCPAVRPLENLESNFHCQLPKLKAYSSSGYLLGRLGNLPFQTDMLLGDRAFPHLSHTLRMKSNAEPDIHLSRNPSPDSKGLIEVTFGLTSHAETNTSGDPDTADHRESSPVSNSVSSALQQEPPSIVANSGPVIGSDAEVSSTTSDASCRVPRSSKRKKRKGISGSKAKNATVINSVEDLQRKEAEPVVPAISQIHDTHQMELNSVDCVALNHTDNSRDLNVACEDPASKNTISMANNVYSLQSDVASAIPELSEFSGTLDEDFTLVVDKKHRRKKKQVPDIAPAGGIARTNANATSYQVHKPIANGYSEVNSDQKASAVMSHGPMRFPNPHFHDRSKSFATAPRSVPSTFSNGHDSVRNAQCIPKSNAWPAPPTSPAASRNSTKALAVESNLHPKLVVKPVQHPASTSFSVSRHSSPAIFTRATSLAASHGPCVQTRAIANAKHHDQHERLKQFLLTTWNSFCTNSLRL